MNGSVIADKAQEKSQRSREGTLAFDVSSAPTRTVLVTGGARRIGRAICERLVADGWRVMVHSRRQDDQDAIALAARIGGVAIAADLSGPLAAARLFQSACDIAPGLCAIVNNAAMFSPEAELPPATAEALRRVNVEVPEKLTTLLGLRLMEHPPFRGAVVDLLDCHILVPPVSGEKETPYLESKRALLASMEKSAGLFASCLRVNAVAPGPVLVPSNPSHRVPGGEVLLPVRPTVDDVASAVSYLLGAQAVTGQVLAVDSGQSLLMDCRAAPFLD